MEQHRDRAFFADPPHGFADQGGNVDVADFTTSADRLGGADAVGHNEA